MSRPEKILIKTWSLMQTLIPNHMHLQIQRYQWHTNPGCCEITFLQKSREAKYGASANSTSRRGWNFPRECRGAASLFPPHTLCSYWTLQDLQRIHVILSFHFHGICTFKVSCLIAPACEHLVHIFKLVLLPLILRDKSNTDFFFPLCIFTKELL